MANTTSTATVLDQTSDAAFRTWVAEIITTLTTTLTPGLSQTNDTGQINTSTVTRPAINTAAGYSIFRYTDSLGQGPIATTNNLVGGSAYTNGTYTAVPLTGGLGTGALATVVVSGGAVSSVTITTAGTGYNVCDQLSALAATIGGTGSGFHVNVATLTSGSPVVIKLEYGAATAITIPQMWITLGQGSNGSGTLTGTTTTRVAVVSGNSLVSTVTSYTSRFIVNMTVGYVGLAWKFGASGSTAGITLGGFRIFRSNDSTGAPSGDSINLTTNSSNATGVTTGGGCAQSYSYLTNTVYPTVLSAANCGTWLGSNGLATGMPFNLATTTVGGVSYTVPEYYVTPVPSVSAYNCAALNAEAALGTTFVEAIVGSTTHTFLSVGQPYGTSGLGASTALAAVMNDCWLWE